MIIKPKVRGFICINAHPQGCAANVQQQIAFTQKKGPIQGAPKKVLVLGCSTGFGLSSRITAAFGGGADTLGVCFEKAPTDDKCATAGYYNTSAFHDAAKAAGLYAHTLNGDAFSDACKEQVVKQIKEDLGQVDLVIYSLASPRRTDPKTGEVYSSTLKPIGKSYVSKNLNTDTMKIGQVEISPATPEEIEGTVKVMGGEDWELWIDLLIKENLLAPGCKTVAYTYLGDKLTWPIYGKATIGKAKEDLDRAARALISKMGTLKGDARVAVLKAVVSQASAAIPVMPLYLAILFKVMKEQGTHEGCIEQLQRLFTECLYSANPRVDDANRYRVDELELSPEVQSKVEAIWEQVTEENLNEITDFKGYREEFLKLFGFGVASIDYEAETSTLVATNF